MRTARSQGYGETNLRQRAYVWDNGVMTDLGTLGRADQAFGINDNGQVVDRLMQRAHTRSGRRAAS